MTETTPISARSLVIYEIYTRNYSPAGTFQAVEADLERIRALGVDYLWFMPIHPIGQVERKGRLGSPYAISDYRGINPEFGTLADFTRLVNRAHALGLKVMIDVIYNHTAHDSVLLREHPQWFYQDASGVAPTTVPEWSDIIDLKYGDPALEDALAANLVYWAQQGVDGFRCDVASLVPLSFWQRARREVEAVRPGVLWLAESVHAGFVEGRRAAGLRAASDSELYTAFDITYDYDIWPIWQQVVQGKQPLERYLEMLRFQDAVYPRNFLKLRCVENHDQARIQALAPSPAQALAWTAFQGFNKGVFLIYNGQESAARHTPTLFDRDPIDLRETPLQPFLAALARIKKDPAVLRGTFMLLESSPAVQAAWLDGEYTLLGVFNVNAAQGSAAVPLPDGQYADLLGGGEVHVQAGRVELPESAFILRGPLTRSPRPFYAPLLDYNWPAE